ncbi:hypothetical protein ACEPAI_8604 [Sanghuangporus weigelae]
MFLLLGKVLLALYIVKRAHFLWTARVTFSRYIPVQHSAFPALSLIGAILPKSRFYRTLGFHWNERQTLYKDAPLNTLALVPALAGRTLVMSSNLDAFYQSLSLNSAFHKAPNSVLEMFGDNVVTTIGDTWKRHRRITAPSFSHSTYRNVWNTTVSVYTDMLDKEGWNNVDENRLTDINKATHKLALFLIAVVGFGIPMSWHEPPRDDNGKLSAQRMIFDIATYIMERGIIPRWAYFLGIEKLKQIDEAYNRFEEFMQERIAEREAELLKLRAMEGGEVDLSIDLNSIFGRLVNARLTEGKNSLSDREIIGNCFAFTFAGHETTANSLAATLGLLALNPDEQEWVYNSIIETIGGREPVFDDFDHLDGVLACIHEGIRMYPAAYLLAEIASKDTTLHLSRRENPDVKEAVPLKKGTPLILDMVGMCYNAQSFPEPESFKPQRWKRSSKTSGAVPTAQVTQADEITGSSSISTFEGFIGFAYGPRTCIGHKFAKVESVAFLTLLLRDWRVVPVMKVGESKEAWRNRVLEPGFGQALLLGEVPVKLVKRK